MLTPQESGPKGDAESDQPKGAGRIDGAFASAGAADAPTVQRGSGSSSRKAAGANSDTARTIPRPGDQIGGFLLEQVIGEGGMGAVFRAVDPRLDREVALKLLPLAQDADPEVVQRFLEEGRSAARLDHENVARVYSIGQDGPYHYIAFEYIAGETIRQRVETTGPLTPAQAITITLEIAHALVHSASRGVVHRDIKPSNIIITPQGRAKLVDMGLARRFEREGDQGLTQTGVTLGTFDYISPEQARDPRDVDIRSDLYSLGCTLYHMLTGHPPFPGGTWLQKLIQHQEERPPDPRSERPEIPASLAALTVKLMAKDRERRCQSPEILVRDLIVIAADLGVDLGGDGHGWGDPLPRAAWERHLAWSAPAAGFVLVLLALVAWNRETPDPAAPRPERPVVAARPIEPARVGGPESKPSAGGDPSPPVEPPQFNPRTIPVSSNEDLLEILSQAPPRSVVVLADDGPYRIGGRAWSSRPTPPLANLDLTIKPEAGVRPMIRFASDAFLAERPSSTIFEFIGGRIVLDGLDFEVESTDGNLALTAIKVDGAELTIRGCTFRRPSSQGAENVTALAIKAFEGRSWTERPPAVVVDASHFDGDQIGLRASGAVDVVLRDCTMGPGVPSFLLGDSARPTNSPVELRLMHSSILVGETEVFRIKGGPARVWADDCVIARSGARSGTLVAVPDERELIWRGRSNLYGGIGEFLRVGGADKGVDFARWSDAASLRETGGRAVSASPWAAAEPAVTLKKYRENPSRAFQLAAAGGGQAGARQGPQGAIPRPVIAAPPEVNLVASKDPARPLDQADTFARPGSRGEPIIDELTNPRAIRDPKGEADDPMTLPTMPPSTQLEAENRPPANPDPPVVQSPTQESRPTSPERDADRELKQTDPAMVHDASRLADELRRAGQRGGIVTLAPGSRIDTPTIVLEGDGRREILAGPDGERPRLRLRIPAGSPPLANAWTTLLDLRSGSLRIKGVDLIVTETDPSSSARVAAVGVASGAELTLENCTLTIASTRAGATALVVPPPTSARIDSNTPREAVIRVRDCFLRSGGDGVAVTGGRRLDLELTNVLASSEGSLIHAHGAARGGRTEKFAVNLRIDQSTLRVKGGVVHLDSTPDAPRISSASIVAEHSIITTADSIDPIFRLDGQDQLDDLNDKIRWESLAVVYDHIKTYRRDEVVGFGVMPRVYDRAHWLSVFQPKEESPSLVEVKFSNPAGSSVSAWTLDKDNLRLPATSPVHDLGPDLDRVPDAPRSSAL